MTKDHPTSSPPSPELVSELHRLVGRNSLRYQRIEIIIKKLLQFLSLTVEIGPNGDASIISEQDHKPSTLGTIAKEFMRVFENSNNINEPKTLITNNSIISTRIKIPTDDQELDKLKILMSNVINQRNYMTHHLLSEIISEDPSSISNAMKQLEISFNQANTLLEELNQIIKLIQENFKIFQDSNFVDLVSNDYSEQVIIKRLYDIYEEKKEWVCMATAGKTLRDGVHSHYETVVNPKKGNSLKALMVKSNFFEFKEENGRLFYKTANPSTN